MQETRFDIALKQKVNNYESLVPGDMWERIIAEKRRRRFAFMWRTLLFLLLLSGVGMAGYFVIGEKNKNDIGHAQTENIGQPGTNVNEDKPQHNVKETTGNNVNITTTKPDNKISQEFTINNQLEQAENYNNRKHAKKQLLNRFTLSKDNVPPPQYQFISDQIQSHSNDTIIIAPTQTLLIPAKGKLVAGDSTLTAAAINIPGKEDRFSVELMISPYIPVNELHSTDKTYEALLKKSGNMQLSFNLGVRMKYHISKRLAAKIGVQYTHITNKMNFADAFAHHYLSTNQYTSVSIPLLFSYKTAWLRNASLSFNTGILLNIIAHYKGLIPSEQGQPVDIGKDGVYNKNVGASFYFSVDFSKKIRDRTELFIEPWFNYRLKNMVAPLFPFEQRIHGFGIFFGARYRLFKNDFH